ncbi:MAG: hypothetical protein RLZZ94_804 [Bacteroidota bacterium]
MGKIVLSSSDNKILDMSHLSSGVYMIRFSTDNGTELRRVVLEK